MRKVRVKGMCFDLSNPNKRSWFSFIVLLVWLVVSFPPGLQSFRGEGIHGSLHSGGEKLVRIKEDMRDSAIRQSARHKGAVPRVFMFPV